VFHQLFFEPQLPIFVVVDQELIVVKALVIFFLELWFSIFFTDVDVTLVLVPLLPLLVQLLQLLPQLWILASVVLGLH